MRKIRVLVVDDAVVIRRVLERVLSADPALEVVGSVADGRAALDSIRQLQPDIVTLDVDMPGMDGLAALAAMRESHPKLPVIMFSALTERGACVTLDALALGAADYVTKPADASNPDAAVRHVRTQLIPKVKAICAAVATTAPAASAGFLAGTRADAVPRLPAASRRVTADVVAIGVSTGGPNALDVLLPALPADFPVPILIVQHMPPIFTRSLAERLSRRCAISVCEASSGDAVQPGRACIAPGDQHMIVARDGAAVRVRTHRGPPVNSCRPAADVLFESVAEVYGARSLGVVMTGMGQDGCSGSERIRRAGGQIIAQDEATSVVWGMPGGVVRAGLADAVLPLGQLACEIIQRVRPHQAALGSAEAERTTGKSKPCSLSR